MKRKRNEFSGRSGINDKRLLIENCKLPSHENF